MPVEKAATSRSGTPGRLPGVPELPAFETLVDRYGGTVLRVCRAVVGWHDAQDAWSETFLAALRAYPRLTPGSNLEAWLVTIAHRKALDIVRREARSRPVAEIDDGVAPDRADARDLDMWAALAELAPKQRAAVAYHYLGGLSHREVAGLLGGTEAAARRAAADGVARLRRRLGASAALTTTGEGRSG